MYSFFAEESCFANIGLQKSDIVFYRVTDSTNTRAREAFLASPSDAPRLYVAEEQTAGRGTRGRSFESKPGGLYFSLLYSPEEECDPTGMTAVAAAAVYKAVRTAIGRKAAGRMLIKWVNDVYIDGRKIAGILSEKITANGRVGYIVGIGINLFGRDFSPEVAKIAASVEDLTGAAPDKEKLLYEILESLIPALSSPKKSPLARIYRRHGLPRGTKITVTDATGNAKEATVMGLGTDFSLLVRYANGECASLISGDVTVKL